MTGHVVGPCLKTVCHMKEEEHRPLWCILLVTRGTETQFTQSVPEESVQDVELVLNHYYVFSGCRLRCLLSLQPFARSVDTLLNLRPATISDSPHGWLTWPPGVLCSTSCLDWGGGAVSRAGFSPHKRFPLCFRATLQPGAVRLPQREDAVYPHVLAVWRLDGMRGQERRDGLSPWVHPPCYRTPATQSIFPRRTAAPRNVLGSLKSRKHLVGPECICFFLHPGWLKDAQRPNQAVIIHDQWCVLATCELNRPAAPNHPLKRKGVCRDNKTGAIRLGIFGTTGG